MLATVGMDVAGARNNLPPIAQNVRVIRVENDRLPVAGLCPLRPQKLA